MPFYDRVKESSTITGTGNIILGGAMTGGCFTFASRFSVGDTVRYCIVLSATGEVEIGIGTLNDLITIQRNTVLESSNANALVNFSAGTKEVFNTFNGDYMRRCCTQGLALAKVQGYITL